MIFAEESPDVGWHVSVSHPTRYPTLEEVEHIRQELVPDDASMSLPVRSPLDPPSPPGRRTVHIVQSHLPQAAAVIAEHAIDPDEIVAQMREFAADLGLGDDQSYDLEAFAKWVGGKQSKQIILVPCSMPQAMPSLWIEYENEHCVLFEASLPPQEKTHTVLKELSHILLGHAPLIKTGGDYRVSAIGASDN